MLVGESLLVSHYSMGWSETRLNRERFTENVEENCPLPDDEIFGIWRGAIKKITHMDINRLNDPVISIVGYLMKNAGKFEHEEFNREFLRHIQMIKKLANTEFLKLLWCKLPDTYSVAKALDKIERELDEI